MNRDEIEAGDGSVIMEREYPHPPERVWEALTDQKALSDWLLPTTTRPILGGGFQMIQRAPGGRPRRVQCRVVELDAPHRLAYSWKSEEDAAPSLVCWTLEPVEGGTHVRLEHILPEGGNIALSASAGVRFRGASALACLGLWMGRIMANGKYGRYSTDRTGISHASDLSHLSRGLAKDPRRAATCR